MKGVFEEASNLQKDLADFVAEDTEAFNRVAEVFKMQRHKNF